MRNYNHEFIFFYISIVRVLPEEGKYEAILKLWDLTSLVQCLNVEAATAYSLLKLLLWGQINHISCPYLLVMIS